MPQIHFMSSNKIEVSHKGNNRVAHYLLGNTRVTRQTFSRLDLVNMCDPFLPKPEKKAKFSMSERNALREIMRRSSHAVVRQELRE